MGPSSLRGAPRPVGKDISSRCHLSRCGTGIQTLGCKTPSRLELRPTLLECPTILVASFLLYQTQLPFTVRHCVSRWAKYHSKDVANSRQSLRRHRTWSLHKSYLWAQPRSGFVWWQSVGTLPRGRQLPPSQRTWLPTYMLGVSHYIWHIPRG